MTKQETIAVSVGGLILIILVAFIAVLCTSRVYDKEQSQQFKEIIAARDSSLEREKLEREAILLSIADLNKNIQAGKASSEASLNKVAANKPFYQDNTKKYESIPAIVRGMSNDSLQSAIERYYENH